MNPEWLVPKEPPSDRILQELSQQYEDVDVSAVHCVVTLLRVSEELRSAMSQLFVRYKLSQGRFIVLLMLHTTSGGEMCCSDIAESVGVSRATMTGLLDGLERDGLVRRVDHPEDRRRVTISLTGNGRRILDDLLPNHFRALAGLMAGLNAQERGALCQLLDRVRAGMSAFRK